MRQANTMFIRVYTSLYESNKKQFLFAGVTIVVITESQVISTQIIVKEHPIIGGPLLPPIDKRRPLETRINSRSVFSVRLPINRFYLALN